MLHKYRSCMSQKDREPLSGRVEVAEMFIGSAEAGKPGRPRSKAVPVAIVVEMTEEGRMGRARMRVLPDAKGSTLGPFVQDVVKAPSIVVTDGWSGYNGIEDLGLIHTPLSQRQSRIASREIGEEAPDLLPGPH